MEMIDITMTATLRPEVIEQTLKSFKEKMFKKHEARLIINIDPVGRMSVEQWEIVKLVKGFFPNVIARCPDDASFPVAFKWTWSQVESSIFFHLEDDWALLKEIDLLHLSKLFYDAEGVAILRLPFSPCNEKNKCWGHWLTWNGKFYEVSHGERGAIGFSGHPSMISKRFRDIAFPLLRDDRNPEKSLKWRAYERIGAKLQALQYGVYGKPGEPHAIEDIGKYWKQQNGWTKPEPKGLFRVWERK